MTSPVIVGTVAVEIEASAKGFAKRLRDAVVKEFKSAGLDKVLAEHLGKRPIKVPVTPDFDDKAIPKAIPKSRAPKLPVTLDPLTKAFQADIKRELGRLAKTANAGIPVSADTAGLRNEVAAEIAAIEQTLKADIPTEPEGRAGYEAKLRAMVASATRSVTAKVHVDVDVDRRGLDGVSGAAGQAAAAVRGLGSAAGSVGTSILSAFGSAGSAVGRIAGPAGSAAIALAGVASAAALIGPAAGAAAAAVGALAGAIASLPALAVGGASAFGAFGLALGGVGDAFKAMGKSAAGGGGGGGGGQSVAARARQIAAATRGIDQAERGLTAALRQETRAQEEVRRAQAAVNQARKDAVERLDDLGRSLRGAQIDEREAVANLKDAFADLEAARRSNDLREIERAEIAYDRAKLAVEQTADATGDLSEEQRDAAKKGVKAADEVVAALDRQRDAQDQLLSAQDGVLSAQESLVAANEALAAAREKAASAGGGGGGIDEFAEALAKLSPNARKFVLAVKSLKPAFDDLKRSVQDRFFSGLDRVVLDVGRTWQPVLKRRLGEVAGSFNTFFKDLGRSVTTPKFVDDISTSMDNFRTGVLDPILKALSGPAVAAFGSLARAAKPFLDAIGRNIADRITDLSEFIVAGEKSGKLQAFFVKAAGFVDKLFKAGDHIVSILGSIGKILFRSDAESGLMDGLESLDKWLADPKTQQSITDFIDDVKAVSRAIEDVSWLIKALTFTPLTIPIKMDWKGVWDGIAAGFKTGWDAFVADIKMRAVEPFLALVDAVKDFLGISSPSTVFADIAHDIAAGLIGGLQARLGAVPALFRTAVTRSVTALGTLAGRITAPLAVFRTRLLSAVSGAVNTAVVYLRNLPGRAAVAVSGLASRIRAAVGNLGSVLYNAGQAVISGLMDGIRSMFGSLGSFLGGVGRFIQDNKGPIEKDRKLLVGAGRAIMGGLIAGIGAEREALRRELDAVSAQVAGGVTARLSATSALPGLAMAVSAAAADPAPIAVTLGWARGATGDPLLDAFRHLIGAKWGGDPVRALKS